MQCREVRLTGREPSLRLQISTPGRAVPATLFEGPEVCLMLLSGCAADCLPHGGTFYLQPHQVTRIITGIAAARLLLRQTRWGARCADALEESGPAAAGARFGAAELRTNDCRETARLSAPAGRPSDAVRS